MELKDFNRIEIDEPGEYFLVSKSVLEGLLARPDHGLNVNQRFGRIVVEFRKQLGMSQPVLASASGISERTLRSIEGGARKPQSDSVAGLRSALGPDFESRVIAQGLGTLLIEEETANEDGRLLKTEKEP